MTAMSTQQLNAWNRPFLDGRSNNADVEQPRAGWRVGLSINL